MLSSGSKPPDRPESLQGASRELGHGGLGIWGVARDSPAAYLASVGGWVCSRVLGTGPEIPCFCIDDVQRFAVPPEPAHMSRSGM